MDDSPVRRELAAPSRVGRYTAVRLETTAERAAALASSPDVASVWPWTPPRMNDERSGQVIAGAETSEWQGRIGARGDNHVHL